MNTMEVCSYYENSSDEEMQSLPSSQPCSSDGNKSLLELIRKKLSVEHICGEWIDFYMKSPEAALVKFMQFVVDASGSRYKLPADLKFPFDYEQIRSDATIYFKGSSSFYPLIMKTQSAIAVQITDFVQKLLLMADGTTIIFDDVFLKHIIDFLMVFADSKVRAFRHTSTLIVVKMLTTMDGLVAVEYNKLELLWLELFNRVFKARIRDVVDDIRIICIAEYHVWLQKFPQCFLKDRDAKLLFTALHDHVPKVREHSLQGVLALLNVELLQPVLLELSVKFRATLLVLTVDPDCELGELAVKLLVHLYSLSPDILREDMCQHIEKLIFAAHCGLAQAASQLFNLCRFRSEPSDTTDNQRIYKLIQQLVEFFIEFAEHDHASYLVDAFYDTNDIVMNWSCMVDMLLQHPAKVKNVLSTREQSVLIEIMTCAVKQAVTGQIPPGRYTKDLSRKPKPLAKQKATQCLIPTLPALIQKYRQSDQLDDIINLLELPQYMDSSIYLADANRVLLNELLDQISEIIFMEVTDMKVIQMGAMTLENILNSHENLPDELYGRRLELLSNAINNYKAAYETFEQNLEGSVQFLPNLKLLVALYGQFNLSTWDMTNALIDSLKIAVKYINTTRFPSDALDLYLEICYCALNWDFKRIIDASPGLNLDELCANLHENSENFLFVCFYLIQYMKYTISAYKAYGYVSDIFALFADQLRQHPNAAIRNLEYKSSENEHQVLEDFLLQRILATPAKELLEPTRFDLLQENRSLLISYCKLVAFNLIPTMRACVVFQHYDEYNAPFGDIIKATMEHAQRINAINYGMTILHTCLLGYKRVRALTATAVEAAKSPEFERLIKLAKRLAETFNIDRLWIREGIITFHCAGIMFVREHAPMYPTAAPDNMLFLSVLQQFSPQLLLQDKRFMLEYLQNLEQTALPSCRAEEWQPLEAYRLSLTTPTRRTSYNHEDVPMEEEAI